MNARKVYLRQTLGTYWQVERSLAVPPSVNPRYGTVGIVSYSGYAQCVRTEKRVVVVRREGVVTVRVARVMPWSPSAINWNNEHSVDDDAWYLDIIRYLWRMYHIPSTNGDEQILVPAEYRCACGCVIHGASRRYWYSNICSRHEQVLLYRDQTYRLLALPSKDLLALVRAWREEQGDVRQGAFTL